MAKDANETVIQIDHQTGIASVWTCNRRIKGKLARIRARKVREQVGGVWFELPEAGISFRKPRKSGGSQRITGAAARSVRESHEPDASTAD